DQFGGWSDSGYCNKEYDQMYQQQGVTVDQNARQQIVYQMQQLAYNDRPYIMLNYVNVLEAHSPKWDGFVESPQAAFNPLSIQTMTQVHRGGGGGGVKGGVGGPGGVAATSEARQLRSPWLVSDPP